VKRTLPSEQFACERCFGFPELRDRFDTNNLKLNCHWCGARSAKVLPLDAFGDEFRDVVSQFYQPDDHGEFVDELLLSDWPRILSRRFQQKSAEHRRSFLVAVLEAGMTQKELYTEGLDFSGLFSRRPSALVDDWQDKIERIIRGDDTILSEMPNESRNEDGVPSRLEVALEDLSCELPAGTFLFRARIHEPSTRKELFTILDLQAPPPKDATAGRANREGEPVLYLASNINTAIAEARAFKGAAVAVGDVRVIRDLRLIDTIESGGLRIPFGCELMKWRCDVLELFRRFGWELSRPILPKEQKQGYEPTQHLAEFVRQCGYAGIKYPSAMGAGYNVVLFNPLDGRVEKVSYRRVRAVAVSKRPFGPYEAPYEEGAYDYLFNVTTEK